MIIHASIPADHPETVARTIALLWRGEAAPFPPVPGSWMAYAHDGRGSMIEVSPRDLKFVPGPDAVLSEAQPGTPRYCSSHLLISSVLSEEEIIAVGAQQGWTARKCWRGPPGMGFELIEFWVEDAFMLEVVTAELAQRYVDFNNGAAQQMFGLKKAA
jgi:hypothetical protein